MTAVYLSDSVLDQCPSEFICSFVGEEEDKLQQMYKVTWPRQILATSEPLSQGPHSASLCFQHEVGRSELIFAWPLASWDRKRGTMHRCIRRLVHRAFCRRAACGPSHLATVASEASGSVSLPSRESSSTFCAQHHLLSVYRLNVHYLEHFRSKVARFGFSPDSGIFVSTS